MAKRRNSRAGSRKAKPLPSEPVNLIINSLSHEGRGVGKVEGKTVFVDGALIGEEVSAQITFQRGKFDEARAVSIENPNPERVIPPCEFYGTCGGCSMQHLTSSAQILHKQSILKEQLEHFASTKPQEWLEPLQADLTAYRRKARLGVRYVSKKERTLIGFREKYSNFLADIKSCKVLDVRVDAILMPMSELIDTMDSRQFIPQIEVTCGDDSVAIIVRHLQPLTEKDRALWISFAQQQNIIVYLQSKGPKTVARLWPIENSDALLSYKLPEYDLELLMEPLDFSQVNASINRKMLPLAIDLLEVNKEDEVLDLFCGLGNFTLPLAKIAKRVVGVEGVIDMVERATENAKHNNLKNVQFYQTDLASDLTGQPWISTNFNKILIDPARSGAIEVIPNIIKFNPDRIVYVSCNPATLARDTGELVKSGYELIKAGVMDMFPHTSHVESIALFVKKK